MRRRSLCKVLGGFHPDYQAVLDYMTANAITHPTAAQNIINNAIFENLEAEGISVTDDFDLFYFYNQDANLDAVRVNWANPSSNYLGMTANNPVFVANEGVYPNATSPSYFTTGFTPSTDAVNCLKEDSSLIYKTITPPGATGDFYICGGRGGTSSETYIRYRYPDSQLFCRHYGNDGNYNHSDNDSHHIHHNGNGSVFTLYYDGSLVYTGTNVTTGGLTVQEIYILAINSVTQYTGPGDGLEYMIWGKEFSSKQLEIYQILNGLY